MQVRRIFLGAEPSRVYNPGSMKNPESMVYFIEFARNIKNGGTNAARRASKAH